MPCARRSGHIHSTSVQGEQNPADRWVTQSPGSSGVPPLPATHGSGPTDRPDKQWPFPKESVWLSQQCQATSRRGVPRTREGAGLGPTPTYHKKLFGGTPCSHSKKSAFSAGRCRGQRCPCRMGRARPRAVLPIPVPGSLPAPKCQCHCSRDSSCPTRQHLEGRGSFSPKCMSHLCTPVPAAQGFSPSHLHVKSCAPKLLRAFFLFSLCQLLLFDLQKQVRTPGERPSGTAEFSSAPHTPCHSPAGPSWQSKPVHPFPELPHQVWLGQEQGTPGNCSPVPTWALCPPSGQPEYTPQCVGSLPSSLRTMGEFVSQSHLDFP